jgi:hypothetical protein
VGARASVERACHIRVSQFPRSFDLQRAFIAQPTRILNPGGPYMKRWDLFVSARTCERTSGCSDSVHMTAIGRWERRFFTRRL